MERENSLLFTYMAQKILILDKNGNSFSSAAPTLRNNGFEVVGAPGTEEALSLLDKDPSISLLLMDIDFERDNSVARTAEKILLRHELPIVFLTHHAEQKYLDKIRGINSYGYVLKESGEFILIESIKMAYRLFSAHQATKESEEKYRAAFMTSPDSININNMDGLYVDINDGFTTLTGYTREEVIGKLSSEIHIWAIPEDRVRLVEGLRKNGEVVDLESMFRCKNGSLKTGLMSARIISIKNEPHILSITRDITKKKEVEEQLKSSEHRFKAIFDQAADGILIGSNQGIITDTNISMCQMTGYSQEELIGNSINILFPSDELHHQPLRYDLVYTGTTVQRERTIVTKDGRRLPVLMNTKKVEDNCLQAIFHDLSDLRTAEQSLRKSEERFRLAVEGSRDGLWDWNLQTGKAYYSDRFATMLGYEPKEIPHTEAAWQDLLHPEDKEAALEHVADYLERKVDYYESTFRMKAKNGSYRWITSRGKALFDDQGTPIRFVGFNTDISAQKKQTDEVKRLLEEKDFLLKEVTHRVKNNLAMISSLINLKQSALKDKLDLSDLKHQINAIRIVHDKLHSSHEYSFIDFEAYSRELLKEIFSASTTPPVKLEIEMEDAELPAKTIIPLGLILNETATNAIKHGFSPDTEAHFKVHMSRDPQLDQYSLSLSNSGKPFEGTLDTTSAETVGVPLIKALVAQIRGTLELETEPQTNFIIKFPISPTQFSSH